MKVENCDVLSCEEQSGGTHPIVSGNRENRGVVSACLTIERSTLEGHIQSLAETRLLCAAQQNGSSWEDKLLRLIVQKCEEHSGRTISMRETFMKMDKDKSGSIDVHDLQEVLQLWTGMSLSHDDMSAVARRFNPSGDGKIR